MWTIHFYKILHVLRSIMALHSENHVLLAQALVTWKGKQSYHYNKREKDLKPSLKAIRKRRIGTGRVKHINIFLHPELSKVVIFFLTPSKTSWNSSAKESMLLLYRYFLSSLCFFGCFWVVSHELCFWWLEENSFSLYFFYHCV